jgi:16S rRNA (guanine(966)-N(2))-methyltransferase RsmD
MNINQYKILSGKFRGKNINLPVTDETRPTKSIVRESFINSVRSELPYVHLVEMFGGSGSVGIEALSNHLAHATFLEISSVVAKVLKGNLSMLGANNSNIIVGNSFETIKPLIKKLQERDQETIFYIDPPFDIRENQENIYNEVLQLFALFPKEITTMITIEHITSQEFPPTIGAFTLQKKKKFGRTTLSYYQPSE